MITTFVLIITNSKFQTTLANKLANEINVEFGTEIAIDKATLSYNGKVDLRDFIIRDHKNDTLVFFKNLYLFNNSNQGHSRLCKNIDFIFIKPNP